MNIHTDTPAIILFLFRMCISVCHLSLALEFDWQIHSDLCGSDHFPVIVKTSSKDDEPSTVHWKLNKDDWLSVRTLCMSLLSDGLVLSKDTVAQFTDILTEIANKTSASLPASNLHELSQLIVVFYVVRSLKKKTFSKMCTFCPV